MKDDSVDGKNLLGTGGFREAGVPTLGNPLSQPHHHLDNCRLFSERGVTIFSHIQMDWRWCISATAEIWYNHIGTFEMQCQLYLSPLTNVFLSKLKTDLLIIVDCDFGCQHFALINVKDDLNIESF